MPFNIPQVVLEGLHQNAIVTVLGTEVASPLIEIVVLAGVGAAFVGPACKVHDLLVFVGLYTYMIADKPFVPGPVTVGLTDQTPLKRHQKMAKVWLLPPPGEVAVLHTWPPVIPIANVAVLAL